MKIDQNKLFFLIAPPRSGTTLVQQLMNTFQGFCNKDESRIAGPNTTSCWQFVIRDDDFSFLEKFIKNKWTKEFFIEKSPPSIYCLPQIAKQYPDANFIFLERNPQKILQSMLNLSFGMSQIGRRSSDLKELLEDFSADLEFEENRARDLLKMVNYQVRYKSLFQKHVVIKYENLVTSLDNNLALLEKTFGIKARPNLAQKILERPSLSSTFRYWYKELRSKKAIAITKLACKLWNYD